MRLSRFITIVGAALACILSPSCTKEGYYSGEWTGTYPIQMLNNDTNEMEDHTAGISLQFIHSGLECIVYTGVVGMIASNRSVYEVKWYSRNNFTLQETKAGQTIQYYSGTINGNKMTFEFLSCDKVERTIELEKVKLMSD